MAYVQLPYADKIINAAGRKLNYEHELVAEKALGKPLPKSVPIHHVNNDGTDNQNRNLVICQDHAYHMLLHARARIVKAGGDPNTDRICSFCKEVLPLSRFSANSTMRKGFMCRECRSARWRRENDGVKRVYRCRPNSWSCAEG